MAEIHHFRRIKWGEPKKLKVLVEDFAPPRRGLPFLLLVSFASAAAFACSFLIF